MNKLLQVIGAKIVEKQMVELTLIPYTSKEVRKKHMGFMEMAIGGMGTKEMIEEIQGHRQQISKLFVTQDEWLNDFKNKLYTSIKLDINIEKEMPNREGSK